MNAVEQKIRISLKGPGTGEVDTKETAMPFSQKDLDIIWRALDISHSTSRSFKPDELARLHEWKVCSDNKEVNERDKCELTEHDIEITVLHHNIRDRLRQTLFQSKDAEKKLGNFLHNISSDEAAHIRLEIPAGGEEQSYDVQLFQYPWELLCYDTDELWDNQRISISRYIRYKEEPPELPILDRLNLLVVTSRPKGDGLEAGQNDDKQSIIKGLEKAIAKNNIEVDTLSLSTRHKLSCYLHDNKHILGKKPHIIHFDGHGDFGRCCVNGHFEHSIKPNNCTICDKPLPEKICGYLAFEKEDGTLDWVSADKLSDTLKPHKISLVVLNACKSGLGRREKDVFNGVAQRLIKDIPAVIASPFKMDWGAAVNFSKYFYQELGNEKSLVEAMDIARHRLRDEDEIMAWYRPVLYLRVNENHEGYMLKSSLDNGYTWKNTAQDFLETSPQPDSYSNENEKLFYADQLYENPFVNDGLPLSSNAPSYIKRKCDEELTTAVKTKKLIIITGVPRSGKSSLLNRVMLADNLKTGWIDCYMDLQGMGSSDSEFFMKNFFDEISYKLGRSIYNWNELSENLDSHPIVFRIDEFGWLEPDLAGIIANFYKLTHADKKEIRIVACMLYPIKEFLQNLKNENPNNIKMRLLNNPKYSEVWHTISVELFRKDESEALLKKLPKDVALIAYEYLETIMEISEGYPSKLQCLCYRLFETSQKTNAKDKLISVIKNKASYNVQT